MKKILILLPLISFLAFGCNLKNITKPGSGEKTENSPAPFTLETLKNANYRFGVKELADVYSKDSLKLTNGLYYFALPQGADRNEYLTKLDQEEKHMAFGDINNDGQSDAAVILISMAGKNRTFQTLAVMLNNKGVAEYSAGAELDQGMIVDSLGIQDGKVWVLEKFFNNSEVKNITYRLNGNELVKE